jgi:HEAT repeat protein
LAIKLVITPIAILACCSFARLGAANQTPKENAEHARAILREGIESKDPDVRIQAIIAASMIGSNDRVLGRLEALLEDKDVPVRLAAVHALADLKSPHSVPALEKTLKQDDVPEVAFAAAKALHVLQVPAGGKALMEVYDGKVNPSSNFVKKETRGILRNFHSVQSTTMFVLHEGMGYVPVPGVGEGFSAMVELLSDPDLSARASVVLLLGKEVDPQSVDLVKKSLTDSDWSVRAAGAQIISHGARAELSESLVPLFQDKKEKVRFRAAGAYLHVYRRQHK